MITVIVVIVMMISILYGVCCPVQCVLFCAMCVEVVVGDAVMMLLIM